MIPREDQIPHFNFPSIFTSVTVGKALSTLAEAFDDSDVRELVLNFEKCHWFEVLALTQLLTILVSKRSARKTLHIVGPCREILPYFHRYIKTLDSRLERIDLTEEDRTRVISSKHRHEKQLPGLRARAGSFLVGWGFFDLLEDQCLCRWYTAREADFTTIDTFREHYIFGYGSNMPVAGYEAGRVWPFNLVYRNEQDQILDRINGEELIAGALKKFAGCDVITNGIAQNVLFFEPVENVFEHAYPEASDDDFGLIVMRVTDWLFDEQKNLTSKAQWLLSRLPQWEQEYLKALGSRGGAFMEIIIADAGQGVAGTLAEALVKDSSYCDKRGIQLADEELNEIDAWEVIRYAFEDHSTRKPDPPPGKRGLAWIKEKLDEYGGLIQIVSDNSTYVLADYGNGLVELTKDILTAAAMAYPAGTYVRLIFPLQAETRPTLDRRPRWGRAPDRQSLFIETRVPNLVCFRVPDSLKGHPELEEWEIFLSQVSSEIVKNRQDIAAMDFEGVVFTRWSLERMFSAFLQHPELIGRVIAINCSRQTISRLDTVTVLEELAVRQLIIPIFETNLRAYWAGASSKNERTLMKWFQDGFGECDDDFCRLAKSNHAYFLFESDVPVALCLKIEQIEALVRHRLGERLSDSLRNRGAVNEGGFIMPLTDITVSTYVEPHQIFADSKIASLLCYHLAVLLRWQYARLAKRDREQHVITATRIGRDIAMRMPESYEHKNTFIYYDYHLLGPNRPRLLKDLPPSYVVIVVDIVTTGTQVEELINICENNDSIILGIISFIDFSPGSEKMVRQFLRRNQTVIEHKTFWRSPQVIRPPVSGDIPVDKNTFSLSAVVESSAKDDLSHAVLSVDRGLRLLEDAEVIHVGHYELFGHHFEFVINFGRLLTISSVSRDEILRHVEKLIIGNKEFPNAIVVYPNLSNAHILHGALERRHRIKALVESDALRFVEARYSVGGQPRTYWLKAHEIDELRNWASAQYPKGYSVLIIDDQSVSGATMWSLINLARELHPRGIAATVIVSQPPFLQGSTTHREFERQIWAKSEFTCVTEIAVPVFTSANCLLCLERAFLISELEKARTTWLKLSIQERVDDLEVRTTLHPQDIPAISKNGRASLGPSFSWHDSKILPGPKQSLPSRAISARIALNNRVPILRILRDIAKASPDLWKLTVIDIARRSDLLQQQEVEIKVRDFLLKVIAEGENDRRVPALEALRQMRSEVLLPIIPEAVKLTLKANYSESAVAELIILLRRAFSSHTLEPIQVFDTELQITHTVDEALSLLPPTSDNRPWVEAIVKEFTPCSGTLHGPSDSAGQQIDILTIVRKLERVLMTSRRAEHRLLYELRRYLANQTIGFDYGVATALENAVRVASLAKIFSAQLREMGALQEESLGQIAQKAYEDARILHQEVENHMRSNVKENIRRIKDKLGKLDLLIVKIEKELRIHVVSPASVIRGEYQRWEREFAGAKPLVRRSIDLSLKPAENSFIIVGKGLFQRIVRNLFLNLKHAMTTNRDGESSIAATIRLNEKLEADGWRVYLSVYCTTRAKGYSENQLEGTTTSQLRLEGDAYRIMHSISERSLSDPKSPWLETWSFGRL
jgi:adenine/guanine phosphoribosyltransferase-like PRPP-binding protein